MERLLKYQNKAKTLVEALPYIKLFNNKTIVIKYGGSFMTDEVLVEKVIDDIALLKLVGMNVIVVHGGGPMINEMLEKLNIKSKFVNGLRETTKEVMEVVEMVLSGKINKNIVKSLQEHNINAIGISGVDGGLIKARKLFVNREDIGFVGEVKQINKEFLTSLLDDDMVPVIAPIGVDDEGNKYNINADYTALSIAEAMEAEKLIYMSNIDGVMKDVKDKDSKISQLSLLESKNLLKSGVISDGMIPKIECCIEAIESGIKNVHIINGMVEHSLILELLTKLGIGTMFYK